MVQTQKDRKYLIFIIMYFTNAWLGMFWLLVLNGGNEKLRISFSFYFHKMCCVISNGNKALTREHVFFIMILQYHLLQPFQVVMDGNEWIE